jgi:RimJ/RimL family protein N-acetyltransferase
VFEHNKASMKILEKNGFHLESIRKKAVIKNNAVMDDHVWVKLIKQTL